MQSYCKYQGAYHSKTVTLPGLMISTSLLPDGISPNSYPSKWYQGISKVFALCSSDLYQGLVALTLAKQLVIRLS